MNWNNPVGCDVPSRLYLSAGKQTVLVATIKKRPSGRLPYYFSQKIIVSYSGSFGSLKAAKRHVEKRLRLFALSIIYIPKRTTQ